MTERPGYLYRAFAAGGDLLYVGATLNPGQRFASHQSQTEWWSEVANVTLEQHPSRMHALAAEGEAIQTEGARYNVFGPKGVLDPDRWLRARREREARRGRLARESYFRDTYAARGSVVCTNCGRFPQRIPKGKTLEELVCKKCRCKTLVHVDGPAVAEHEREEQAA